VRVPGEASKQKTVVPGARTGHLGGFESWGKEKFAAGCGKIVRGTGKKTFHRIGVGGETLGG